MMYCKNIKNLFKNEPTLFFGKDKVCLKLILNELFLQKREKGRMRVHHLNNVNHALQVLEHNNVSITWFFFVVT